jgi:ribosomal protein S15P/S13E
VQRQLQREAIDEYIATAEAEHGPVDTAEVAARAERIRAHHAAHRGDAAGADAA